MVIFFVVFLYPPVAGDVTLNVYLPFGAFFVNLIFAVFPFVIVTFFFLSCFLVLCLWLSP